MDTATIKQLEKMRDEIDANIEYLYCDKGIAQKAKVYALDKVLAYIRTMGEIEAAATEISFNGEQFMHKIYKLGGQWSDVTKEEWFTSLADAWGRIKEQK